MEQLKIKYDKAEKAIKSIDDLLNKLESYDKQE